MSLVSPEVIPLELLQSGETAFVETVCGDLNHVQRLRELGFADGARLEMLQPGVPCIVRLAGQRLCFRADALTSILVRPGAAG
jgi:Fe2+ transport system protein FeoA